MLPSKHCNRWKSVMKSNNSCDNNNNHDNNKPNLTNKKEANSNPFKTLAKYNLIKVLKVLNAGDVGSRVLTRFSFNLT